MISTVKTVPEIIRAENANVPIGRHPVRLLLCGMPQGVERIVHRLHVLDFAEVGEWSPPLPSPVQGEVIRILTRYFIINE